MNNLEKKPNASRCGIFYMISLLVVLNISCHKKDPTACGPDNQKFKYLKTIKNVPADLDRNDGFVIGPQETLFICPYQMDQFANYENTHILNKPSRFKYRISGRVFECRGCPTFSIGYMNFIVIDKITKID
ncbi:hypothetical protein [Runella zeae]|uniref:hypothetical protein n=1 Tax=Runella zeae TaxID=94255 RepID=UPI0023539A58|nr:hypothetical protein [Runella zeae]